MDYSPPKFSKKTSARRYLSAPPPEVIRSFLIDPVDSTEEYLEFLEIRNKWLKIAPEETLRKLIPEAKTLLWVRPEDEDVIDALLSAHWTRGIPSEEELLALADEVDSKVIREALIP